MREKKSRQRSPFFDGTWWLINPALDAPRVLAGPKDTLVHPRDESVTFASLSEEEQDERLLHTWIATVHWLVARGVSRVSAGTLDANVKLVRLGFRPIGRGNDIPDDIGTYEYTGPDLTRVLEELGRVPAVSVCIWRDREPVGYVWEESWEQILVRSDAEPRIPFAAP